MSYYIYFPPAIQLQHESVWSGTNIPSWEMRENVLKKSMEGLSMNFESKENKYNFYLIHVKYL